MVFVEDGCSHGIAYAVAQRLHDSCFVNARAGGSQRARRLLRRHARRYGMAMASARRAIVRGSEEARQQRRRAAEAR